MTDKEIIKALECCANLVECSECPYGSITVCHEEKDKDVLDLINRQQAEIENYSHNIKNLAAANMELYAEIAGMIDHRGYVLKKAKAEAIKECLEWVLSLFPEDKNFTTISRFTVNQKLKEMVGEDNV